MPNHLKCKCLHCHSFYQPDPRNRHHQQYCSKPDCRKASQAASQRRWLAKPANRDYFRGTDNVERVCRWRKQHPGYWRKTPSTHTPPLQEVLPTQPVAPQGIQTSSSTAALQDVLHSQPLLLLGLISMITGTTLQDDIAQSVRSLLTTGQSILGMVPSIQTKGCTDYGDQKTSAAGPPA